MIGKSENGTWFVQIKVKDAQTGKWKTKKKRGFKLKKDAKLAEAEMIQAYGTGLSAPFGAVAKACFDEAEGRPSTREWKDRIIRLHCSELAKLPIDSITKEKLMQWRSDLGGSDLATRTRNQCVQIVKQVFAYAERVYDLKNPAVILKPFKLNKADKREMEVWTPEEFQRFLDAMPESRFIYKKYFEYLYWTGCRRSEAMALCWDDIQGNTVHVHRSIKHYKNGFLGLKTDSSERFITLDDKTLDMVSKLPKTGQFVFGGERSLPITVIQKAFAEGIAESGVKPIRIHDLRHSHATWLINSGVNIVAVSKRLGHSSVNTTLKTYTHLFRDTDAQMVEAINDFRGGTINGTKK